MSKQEDIEKALQAYGLNEKAVVTTVVKKPVKKAPLKTAPVKEEIEKPEPIADPNKQAPAGPSKKKSPVELEVEKIEKRFLATADLMGDLSKFPITQANHLQVKTDKAKSNEHGEVFTPLWLVDKMIEDGIRGGLPFEGHTTRDLCAGYGQFTIRLIRYRVSKDPSFNLSTFLAEDHHIVELQPNSCFRLLYIFGTNICLCMGDATKLGLLPPEAMDGVWVWVEGCGKWTQALTRKGESRVLRLFKDCLGVEPKNGFSAEELTTKAVRFEKGIERLVTEATKESNK